MLTCSFFLLMPLEICTYCGQSKKSVCFYAHEIEDWGAYCFCPVCHSVILSVTLTLLITFEHFVLEL